LSLVDSKQFSAITSEQFDRFAAKVRLTTKLTLDTVQQTMARFADVWRGIGSDFVEPRVREAIDRHLGSVPLWAEFNARRKM
jgi:hypothetical protein